MNIKENEECEVLVTEFLPPNQTKVMAFGHKTYCCELSMDLDCELSMDLDPDWHEVVFYFDICSYKLKKELPEDLGESILETATIKEKWEVDDEDYDEGVSCYLLGVTKWKAIPIDPDE